MKVYILLLVIFISFCVIVYLGHTHHQEHFQQYDSTQIKPCSVLISNTMPYTSQINAKSKIDTNRWKEWNPKNPTLKSHDSNVTYCYVNHDMDNNLHDYMIPKGECTPSNPNLQNTFIADAFEDKSYDQSYNSSFNKCVLKIEKDKINDDNLDVFWRGMGSDSNSCARTQQYIIQVRDNLYNNVKSCILSKEIFTTSNTTLCNWIAKQEVTKSNLATNIANCHLCNNSIEKYINAQLLEKDRLLKSIGDSMMECSKTESDVKNKYVACSNEYQKKLGEFATLLRNQKYLDVQRAELSNNWIVLNSNMEYYQSQLEQNTKMREHYEKEYDILLPIYSQCTASLETETRQLYICNSNLSTLMAQMSELDTEYNTCHVNLQGCTNRVNVCRAQYKSLMSQKLDWYNKIKRLDSEISSNVQQYAIQQGSNLAMKNEIQRLLDMIKKFCVYSTEDVNRLASTRKVLESNYETRYDYYQSAQDKFTSNVQAAESNSSAKLEACENKSAETLYAAINTHWIACKKTKDCTANGKGDVDRFCTNLCRNELGTNWRRNIEYAKDYFKGDTQTFCACRYESSIDTFEYDTSLAKNTVSLIDHFRHPQRLGDRKFT